MNDFGETNEAAKPSAAGNGLGPHLATVAAVLMLVGVAIAVSAWMPSGSARDAIVVWITGVTAWSWLFLVMRLSSERTVMLVAVLPAAVCLAAMIGLMQLTEADRPESIRPIAESAADGDGGAGRG
jgi:hypothetical protein